MPALSPQDADLFAKLTSVAIDSLWGTLDKLGYPDTFIEGVRPMHRDPERKMVGRAVTLRYLPMRKDFSETVAAQQEHSVVRGTS